MTDLCTIDGCDREVRSRGWCATHWARWRRHGDPNKGAAKAAATCEVSGCTDRIQGHGLCPKHYHRRRRGTPVVRPETMRERVEASIVMEDGCWMWTGTRNSNGYPVIGNAGKSIYVHRWMLQQVLGRLLVHGEFTCHHCDRPCCVNPAHLFVGTASDNTADMHAKGRGITTPMDEDALSWLWNRGVPSPYIASLLKVEKHVVTRRARMLGLPKRRGGRPSKADIQRRAQIIEQFIQGGTDDGP